jgi:UDP-glucose 4-epimerase
VNNKTLNPEEVILKLKNSKILVTGGSGFIGSHIVEDLVRAGAIVRVFDNFSSGHIENLEQIRNEIEIIEGDILDMKALLQAASGMDAVSHQAAQLEIIRCIETPIQDLRSNTEGTLNVLEVAKQLNLSKVVYASSACVYGQANYVPEDELHPTTPNWPYGISKLAAEQYARLYNEYYGMETIGLRYSIVYGPREWFGRVLTVFLNRALDGEPPVVWGGEPQRDFIYISDVVRFHRLCLERDGLGNQIFNVSTGIGLSIEELAQLVSDLFNLGEPIYEDVPVGEKSEIVSGRIRLPAELKQMILDPRKAYEHLNWRSDVRLKEGIQKEFDWIQNNTRRWTEMHY